MSSRDRRNLKNITPQASGRGLVLPRPGTGGFKANQGPPANTGGTGSEELLKEECKVVNIL